MSEKGANGRPAFPGKLAAPSTDSEGPSTPRPSAGRAAGSPRILTFDPGNVSGWCLYEAGTVTNGQVGDRGAEPRVRRHAAFDLLTRLVPYCDALGYEWFIPRQAIKEEHADALYIQGAIEYVGWRLSIPVHRYTPRQSKSRVSDDQLKALGFFPPWGMRTGGHAADAARIMVCVLTDEYPQELMA